MNIILSIFIEVHRYTKYMLRVSIFMLTLLLTLLLLELESQLSFSDGSDGANGMKIAYLIYVNKLKFLKWDTRDIPVDSKLNSEQKLSHYYLILKAKITK